MSNFLTHTSPCISFSYDVTVLQAVFEVADATKRSYADESFDVIYSRDTILHIQDKKALFQKFYVRKGDTFIQYSSLYFII